MDSRFAEAPRGSALAAVLLTTAAGMFAYAVQPVWWLAWLAPIPVFAYAVRGGRLAAFACAAIALYAAVMLGWWPFLHDRIRLPVLAIVPALAAPAIVFGLTALALRAFARRGFAIAAPFAAASLWTVLSLVGASTSINGTSGNIAYSQMDFLPVIQIAAFGGVHAIEFVLILFAASVAVLAAPIAPAARLRGAAVGVAVVALVLAGGAWRLRDAVAPTLPVGALSIDDPGAELAPKVGSPAGQALIARYVEGVAATARRGAKIVLVPENVVSIDDAGEAAFEAAFREVARVNAVDVVVGAGRYTAGPNYNLAYVFGADGGAPRKYTKRHLVPGFEKQFARGEGAPLVVDGAARWAVSICKDLDFPAYLRTYGSERPGLVVVPAWDFVDDAWLHNRMAVLRGVENGFAMLRSARNGLITMTDDRGRVLASTASDSAALASLVAKAPTTHRPTWYTRIGDAFSYAAGAAFVLLCAWLAVDARRRASRPSNGGG